MHSSACGCTRSRSSTNRLNVAIRRASTCAPDSSRPSTLMWLPGGSRLAHAGRAPVREARGGVAGLELVVGRDELAHQPVAYDVVAGEPVERDVLEPVEDLLDHAQAAPGASGEVDLGHVTGDDHLRAEAQP